MVSAGIEILLDMAVAVTAGAAQGCSAGVLLLTKHVVSGRLTGWVYILKGHNLRVTTSEKLTSSFDAYRNIRHRM